jgi:hypothetical protein
MLAKMLLRHAARVMPAARADWARAMQAEADHVPSGELLFFAVGCVWSSYSERSRDPRSQVAAGRWAIGIGLAVATAITLRLAAILWGEAAATLILVFGLICMGACAAFFVWGLRRLPLVAAASFGFVLAAFLMLGGADGSMEAATGSSRFYQAILIEQAAGWAALLVLARLLLGIERRRCASE